MKIEKRDLVKCVLLSIITCGVYQIYWIIKIVEDVFNLRDKKEDGIFHAFISIVMPYLGFYFTEKKFTEACEEKGIYHKDNTVLYFILGLFGLSIVNCALLQSDLNKIYDMYNPSACGYGNTYGGTQQNQHYENPYQNPYGSQQNQQYRNSYQTPPYNGSENGNPYNENSKQTAYGKYGQNPPYGAQQQNPPYKNSSENK